MSATVGAESTASSSFGSSGAHNTSMQEKRATVAKLVSAGRSLSSGVSFTMDSKSDEEFEEETKEVFNLFDKDGRGAIDPKEVRLQMSNLGFGADNTTIYQLISDLDSDGSQMLELEEFQGLMNDVLHVNSDEYLSRGNLGEIFEFLDHLDPGQRTSKLELADLRRIANVLGDTISDAELQAMINGADREGKGHVSCEDFYQMMNMSSHRSSSPGSSSEDEAESGKEGAGGGRRSKEEEAAKAKPARGKRGSVAPGKQALRKSVTAISAVHRSQSLSVNLPKQQRSKTVISNGLMRDDGARGSEHRRSTWRKERALTFALSLEGKADEGGEGEGAAGGAADQASGAGGSRRVSIVTGEAGGGDLTSQMAAQAAVVQRAKARYASDASSPTASPR